MSQALFYLIWIPTVVVFYTMYAYMSYRNNLTGAGHGWAWAMWASGIVPIWIFVSRYSKNILFDGMLYDSILFLSYSIAIGILTEAHIKFNGGQLFGVGLVITGFILMQYYGQH